MFEVAFLRKHGLSYPHLRCGEDPVFLASCLAAAPCLSSTSVTCYYYRRSTSCTIRSIDEAFDFIRHVGMIRHVYLTSGNQRCWKQAAEPFYFNDVKTLIARVARTQEHRVLLHEEMRAIWPDTMDDDVDTA
jgi:hypothetical protein